MQERELARQNERLEEFASVVSHDLRNPLNVAEGNLGIVQGDVDDDRLDDVARAHERMDTLIDDLLTLAREGETVGEVEPIDLATIVERCWQNVDTADATLDLRTDRTIRADPSRLQQLLENLVRNGVEHGSTNGRPRADDEGVGITVGDLPDGFYVEDDGPGIPEADRSTVFEAGYSTTEGGTGFGLRIAERIVDAHGWDVRVVDGSDGGARFEITGVEFADG
jgi:signal transduction histidine kinase